MTEVVAQLFDRNIVRRRMVLTVAIGKLAQTAGFAQMKFAILYWQMQKALQIHYTLRIALVAAAECFFLFQLPRLPN